jgi:hypothetical protein
VTCDFQADQGLNVSLLRFSDAGRYRSWELTKRELCREITRLQPRPLRLGCTLTGAVDRPIQNPGDQAVRGRLLHAILAEDGDEQLEGVLRMLGERDPGKDQLPLFGKAPADQTPNR